MKNFLRRGPFNKEGFAGLVAVGVSILLVFIIIAMLFKGCEDRRRAEADARAAEEQARTGKLAGKDAIDIVTKGGERDAQSDATTRETERVIRETPGAEVPINPKLDSAARARLCLRAAYRCQPQCISLLGACPQ